MSSGITRNQLGPAGRVIYDQQKAAQKSPAEMYRSAAIAARIKKGKRDSAHAAQEFLNICDKAGVPRPELEVVFHPTRKWRADFLWRREMLILELDGGVFMPGGGGHNTGAGVRRDHEKLNSAATLGFRVLHVFPEKLLKVDTIAMVRRALRGGRVRR